MSWFKISDDIYDHPKFLDLPHSAAGLWMKSGAWCMKHLTDGIIPATAVRQLRGRPGQVRALLQEGLWEEVEFDGRKAYRFHDFEEYNPSREDVLAKRAAANRRQQNSRSQRRRVDVEIVTNRTSDFATTSTNAEMSQCDMKTAEANRVGRVLQSVGVTNRTSDFAPTSTNAEMSQCDTVAGQMSDMMYDLSTKVNQKRTSDFATTSGNAEMSRCDPSRARNIEKIEGVAKLLDTREQASPSPDFSDDVLPAAAPPPAVAMTPADWSTPDDPRCLEHALIPREQVPACGACADARKWFTAQAEKAKVTRHREIDACPFCDDHGMAHTRFTDGSPAVIKCTHQGPPAVLQSPRHEPRSEASRSIAESIKEQLRQTRAKMGGMGATTR